MTEDDNRGAMRVWNNGAPQARTPEEARQQWAPHLATWGEHVKHVLSNHKLSNYLLSSSFSNKRIGWIDHAPFWDALWDGFVNALPKHAPYGVPEEGWIGPFLREAGALGNRVPFERALAKGIGNYVANKLYEPLGLISPSLASWLAQVAPTYPNEGCSIHPGYDGVEVVWNDMPQALLARWRILQWEYEGEESWFRLSPCLADMDRAVQLVREALLTGTFDAEKQLNVLGHFVANSPNEWFQSSKHGTTLLVALERATQGLLSEDIDLPLMALCSGKSIGLTDGNRQVEQELRMMGHYFLETVAPKVFMAPSGSLGFLPTMYDITDCKSLYQAAHTIQIHKPKAPEVLPIPALSDMDSAPVP